MMSLTSDLLNAPREFLALFRKGKEAAQNGHKQKAHTLFRQAIEIDPYHEHVWLWLASVVETDEDRRVCFENVLELNPSNPTARRQLDKLQHRAALTEVAAQNDESKRPNKRRRIRRWLLEALIAVGSVLAALLHNLI